MSELRWECHGAAKAVVASARLNCIVSAVLCVCMILAFIFDAFDMLFDDLGIWIGIILLALCVALFMIELLQCKTLDSSYLRIYTDRIEFLSMSLDALLKQSWQGVQVVAKRSDIQNVSVAGKRVVVTIAGVQHEVNVPDTEEASKRLQAFMEGR